QARISRGARATPAPRASRTGRATAVELRARAPPASDQVRAGLTYRPQRRHRLDQTSPAPPANVTTMDPSRIMPSRSPIARITGMFALLRLPKLGKVAIVFACSRFA